MRTPPFSLSSLQHHSPTSIPLRHIPHSQVPHSHRSPRFSVGLSLLHPRFLCHPSLSARSLTATVPHGLQPPFPTVFRGAVLPPPQVPPPQGASVSTLFHHKNRRFPHIFPHFLHFFSFIFFGRIKKNTNFAAAPEKLGVRDRVVKIVYHPEVGFHWPHFFITSFSIFSSAI